MDLYTIATVLLFYGVAKGAKEALRTGGGDVITIPEESEEKEKPSRVMALVIVEDVEDSEEKNPSSKNEPIMLPLIENPEVMMPWKQNPQKMLPLIEVAKPKDVYDEDTSGELNSNEYSDSSTESDSDESDTDNESGTDSESNYYHEDDYLKAKIMKKIAKLNPEKNNTMLRNQWKSCQKKASKICRKACVVSYKNACEEQKCKKKLKKVLKKECKRNCKEFFIDS